MKSGKTQKIDDVVHQVLKQMGLERQFREYEVCEVWPEVVGRMIASKTKSIYMNGGSLFVTFTSSVVRSEINMVKEGLIKALNEKIGEDVVKEIVIR